MMKNEKVYAVIVAYNPKIFTLDALVRVLRASNVRCYIIDNSDTTPYHSEMTGVYVIRLGNNKGIARAQNIGIKKCIEAGADKIAFFDQDSVIEKDFFEQLLATFSDNTARIAAPVFYDRVEGFGYKLVNVSKHGFRKKTRPRDISRPCDMTTVISSGMIVRSDVFDKIGLMDERLFIDYVDTEWCLRCAAKNILVSVNPKAVMRHSIGERNIKFFKFNIPVHSPLRRYYRVRNAFILFRFPHVPKLLSLREVFFAFIHQLIIVVFMKNRGEYLRYYWLGLRDGILGVTGRLPH